MISAHVHDASLQKKVYLPNLNHRYRTTSYEPLGQNLRKKPTKKKISSYSLKVTVLIINYSLRFNKLVPPLKKQTNIFTISKHPQNFIYGVLLCYILHACDLKAYIQLVHVQVFTKAILIQKHHSKVQQQFVNCPTWTGLLFLLKKQAFSNFVFPPVGDRVTEIIMKMKILNFIKTLSWILFSSSNWIKKVRLCCICHSLCVRGISKYHSWPDAYYSLFNTWPQAMQAHKHVELCSALRFVFNWHEISGAFRTKSSVSNIKKINSFTYWTNLVLHRTSSFKRS